MKRSFSILLLLAGFGILLFSMQKNLQEKRKTGPGWDASTPVADVLKFFGEPYPAHRPEKLDPEEVKRGMELFTTGVTTSPQGKKVAKQSQYFLCTHCHNNKKEDPSLSVSDPEKRLEWCKANNLPFLPGTTMYGTVNKTSWYNGDYYKKYGELVKPANSSLDEAIHLCATVCSQGRDLEDWEMKAMYAYYWSIQYTMGDLGLTEADWTKLNAAAEKPGSNPEMVKWIKSFYLQGSPATFIDGPEDRTKGFTVARPGDAAKGEAIYTSSCMFCHAEGGPGGHLVLDETKLSKSQLAKNITRTGHMSIYEAIVHGISSDGGYGPYMPLFPRERMNEQQIEDLRAYLLK